MAYNVDPGPVFVCHKCDNPRCVRPDHLFLGTLQDNVDDMLAKGRAPEPRNQSGAFNGNSKLTEDDVREVIRQILAGKTNKAIAASTPVGHAMVSRIRTGRSWRDLSLSMGYEPKPGKTAPKSGRTRFSGKPHPGLARGAHSQDRRE
jgi:molybdopterin-binding protein